MFETFALPNDQIHVIFSKTQPSCLLVVRITSYVHTYARDRSPTHLGHPILTHSAAITTPTAQMGTIVPKASVYVRFVDWGYGPCTKYVVFYTSRDIDEHTAWGYRFASCSFGCQVYGIQFEAI